VKIVGNSLNDFTTSVDQRFQDDGQRIDTNIGALNTINSRIDTIESDANELENSLKNLPDANDKVVIFSVLKTTGGNLTGNMIFHKTEVNIGEAMNIQSGEFKAPFSGTYSFDFSALSQDKQKTVHVQIKKNNNIIYNIYNHLNEESTQRFDNMNFHWMLTLSTGDVITRT